MAANRAQPLDDVPAFDARLRPDADGADEATLRAWVLAKRAVASEEFRDLTERRRCSRHHPHSDGALTAAWRRI